jgi:hypothetical protein
MRENGDESTPTTGPSRASSRRRPRQFGIAYNKMTLGGIVLSHFRFLRKLGRRPNLESEGREFWSKEDRTSPPLKRAKVKKKCCGKQRHVSFEPTWTTPCNQSLTLKGRHKCCAAPPGTNPLASGGTDMRCAQGGERP